jgi:hypothetical protein
MIVDIANYSMNISFNIQGKKVISVIDQDRILNKTSPLLIFKVEPEDAYIDIVDMKDEDNLFRIDLSSLQYKERKEIAEKIVDAEMLFVFYEGNQGMIINRIASNYMNLPS